MDTMSSLTVAAAARATVIPRYCFELSQVLPDKVSFPGDDVYDDSLSSYFSQQEAQVTPNCIVSPTTAEDVSVAVSTMTTGNNGHYSYPFAVRSGGHMFFAGAANAAGGVTLDLRGLDEITINDDHTIVSVGPGNTWLDVYKEMDKWNLGVVGGRAADVGVGGLTTGGGISYFSPRFGWSCDTVANYQVVLANGSIVDANDDQNPHLLHALRGGSNNFGVVTRFDLRAFEQHGLWGGLRTHPIETADQHLQALSKFSSDQDYDEYASVIMNFAVAVGTGRPPTVLTNLEYTKPVENPASLSGFMATPALNDTMRISNMTDISTEQGSFQPNGFRQLCQTITTGTSLPMLRSMFHSWNATLPLISNVTNAVWSISLEPIPPEIYARSGSSNSLGLPPRGHNHHHSHSLPHLMITVMTISWTCPKDDEVVESTLKKFSAEVEGEAKRLDEYNEFLYLNYAAQWQNPIRSYGEESIERLRKVREEVDPDWVFTNRVTGGFKIPGKEEAEEEEKGGQDG